MTDYDLGHIWDDSLCFTVDYSQENKGKLVQAFADAKVDPRLIQYFDSSFANGTSIANAELDSAQESLLRKRRFRPEPGWCTTV